MPRPSYDELAARLRAVEESLADVQALRERMELGSWDPRGGEPRVLDAAGKTLPYVPSIQFLGGVTLDTKKQRAVVAAPAGGGGSSLVVARSDPASATDAPRTIYGPGSVMPTINLASGATLSAQIPGTWAGAFSYVVLGAVRGSSADGADHVRWSFVHDSTAQTITLYFRNGGPSGFTLLQSSWSFVYYVVRNGAP